jgi:hypothetical protein
MKRFAWVVVGLLLVLLLDKLGCVGAPTSEELLIGRYWTVAPGEDARAHRPALMLLDVEQLGVASHSSAYEIHFWIVEWTVTEATLQLHFLQHQISETYAYRVRECPGEAPEGFDLCLDLASPKGKITLYASKDAGEVPAEAKARLEGLEHVEPRGFVEGVSPWTAQRQ